MTTKQEIEFTQEWWKRTTVDESKLIAWVKKLYLTEIGGYDDYQGFLSQFETTERTARILTNIAEDELKHSRILIDLLAGRNESIDPNAPKSTYWQTLDSHITDLDSACAANYYGEALAAFRFEIIAEMDCTPEDVKQALRIILPDEQFHRETLYRLASDETLDKFATIHKQAMEALKGSRK